MDMFPERESSTISLYATVKLLIAIDALPNPAKESFVISVTKVDTSRVKSIFAFKPRSSVPLAVPFMFSFFPTALIVRSTESVFVGSAAESVAGTVAKAFIFPLIDRSRFGFNLIIELMMPAISPKDYPELSFFTFFAIRLIKSLVKGSSLLFKSIDLSVSSPTK